MRKHKVYLLNDAFVFACDTCMLKLYSFDRRYDNMTLRHTPTCIVISEVGYIALDMKYI